jgi:hypothetical protein
MWGTGAGGAAWTGSHGYGGGGGEYARKKVTTVNGDIVNVNDVNGTMYINSGANVLIANAGTNGATPNGGTGGTGDVLFNGGSGADGVVQNGGGGGAGATRDAIGGDGSAGLDISNGGGGGAGGVNDDPAHNGEGGMAVGWFGSNPGPHGEVDSLPGTAPGGGGGAGNGGSDGHGHPGVGGALAWAIWNQWNGDPTMAGTYPVAGSNPVASGGTFQASPPVTDTGDGVHSAVGGHIGDDDFGF